MKGEKMRRVLLLVVSVVALTFAGVAGASGPAASGQDTLTLTCEGIGTVTVRIQPNETSNGVGQIIGSKGHGIPVAFGFTLYDVTTSSVVFADPVAADHGGGHAHSNQATATCTGTVFEGKASDFFGDELPPGVGATDVVRATLTAEVIVKL
jgi:hypothetical protein